MARQYSVPGVGYVNDPSTGDEYLVPPGAYLNEEAPAGDVTAPTITARAINGAGTSLTLTADEAISVGAGGNGGMALTASGGAAGLTYASGDGAASVVYTIDRAIDYDETCTLTYTQPGNGWEDAAGNDLATFTDAAVTNGSGVGAPPSTGALMMLGVG